MKISREYQITNTNSMNHFLLSLEYNSYMKRNQQPINNKAEEVCQLYPSTRLLQFDQVVRS